MAVSNVEAVPSNLEGKSAAVVVCWILGNGCLFSWNSMLTIGDYYAYLFPKYHPARVLTLVYQPFALLTLLALAYKESKVNTRLRNLAGYSLFFISSLLVLLVILILFFAISSLFELLCVVIYAFIFPKLPIVRYYRSKAASEGAKTVSADLAASGIKKATAGDFEEMERLSNKELLYQNFDYAIDLFLIFALTLSIFPGFLSEDTGSHSLGSWYALVLIAMYNVWDLIGRFIPLMESRTGLMMAVLSRFLLVPCFYFTAKYGKQGWMIMLTSLLGLTNGFLTVCVLTSAPKGYKGPEQNALGNILVLFLLGAIFAGVTLDWLWLIGKAW